MNYNYFVPMLVEEFNNLFRLGSIRLPNGRWVAGRQRELPFSEGDDFTDRLLNTIPSFEDTGSVVVVKFINYEPIKGFGHTYAEFYFEDAVAVYTLTSQDQKILANRLGSNSKLVDKLILSESVILSLKKKIIEQSARRGASALLTIYADEIENISRYSKEIDQTVFSAVQARQEGLNSALKGQPYLETLFCYSRTGPIPNFDIGFIQDAGHVLCHYCKSNDKEIEYFGMKEVISEWHERKRSAVVTEILNDLIKKGTSNAFDQYASLPGALVSTVVFLKLCHMMRVENEPLDRQKLQEVLLKIEDQLSVTRGVGWCGAFWGFSEFAAEYYACVPAGSSRPRFRTRFVTPNGPEVKENSLELLVTSNVTEDLVSSNLQQKFGELDSETKSEELTAKSSKGRKTSGQLEQYEDSANNSRTVTSVALGSAGDTSNSISKPVNNSMATKPAACEENLNTGLDGKPIRLLEDNSIPPPPLTAPPTEAFAPRVECVDKTAEKSSKNQKPKTKKTKSKTTSPKNI